MSVSLNKISNMQFSVEDINGMISTHLGADAGEVKDGYHSFNELYEFRKLYNAALFNEWAKEGRGAKTLREAHNNDGFGFQKVDFTPKYNVHKSMRHHDGELCFGGFWFIVVAVLPTGQISNHYELKDWDLFKVPAVEKALFEFDGHTAGDVMERIKSIL